MKIFHVLLVVTMIGCIVTTSKAPIPFCISKPLYHSFPLSIDEKLSYDMATAFTGYNVKLELGSKNAFATITDKFYELDRIDSNYPGIISHYVQQSGNGVGTDSFILYNDTNSVIRLAYGVISDQKKLPKVNATVDVTSDKNVQCFDAALFLDHGLAIIDCVRTDSTLLFSLVNEFYIVDLTTKTLKTIVRSDMFVNFQSITRRKLMKFSHP